MKVTIKENFSNEEKELDIVADFYVAHDFMGKERGVIALMLMEDTEEGKDFYCDVTKGFGEFIGQPCITFLDGNALYDVEKMVTENGIGVRAPFANKQSGFCEYPPYIINPYFLESVYEKKDLAEYLGYYDFGNEHVLSDKEYNEKMSSLKDAYENYCKKNGGVFRKDFEDKNKDIERC